MKSIFEQNGGTYTKVGDVNDIINMFKNYQIKMYD